jgi:hypothetical protein
MLPKLLGLALVDDQPHVILYDVAGQRWLSYDGEFTDAGLRRFIESPVFDWKTIGEVPKSMLKQTWAPYIAFGVMIVLLLTQIGVCRSRTRRRPGMYSKL